MIMSTLHFVVGKKREKTPGTITFFIMVGSGAETA